MSLVSVVIPTLKRPQLLLRAINSVLQQTHRELEVIVIAGRPDLDTVDAVRSVADPRVRLFETPESLTAGGARNAGADQAKGEWVAFLDDDDEWLPDKLARQLALAASRDSTLVTCLSRIVTSTGSYVRPKAVYDGSVPIDEYLFDRRRLFGGSSFIGTPSFFLPRHVLDKVRFDEDNPDDDWDFLLHLSKHENVTIDTVPEVLVLVHSEGTHSHLTSRTSSWASLSYLDKMQPFLTRRAYSGYCLNVVGERAARERAYRMFPKLLHRAFRYGSPRLSHVLPYFAYWLLPRGLLRRLRNSIQHSSFPSIAFHHYRIRHFGRECL